MESMPQSNTWNPPTRRWVIESPNTAYEHVRQLYDASHPAGAGRPPRPGQEVFEGSLEDFETAKEKANTRAFMRCGFCGDLKPCLRED